MRDKILVITGSDEPNVPEVLTHIRDDRVVRIDTDKFADYRASISIQKEGRVNFRLSIADQFVSFDNLLSVWYRRPPSISLLSLGELSEPDRQFVQNETDRFLWTLWHSTPSDTVWTNHPASIRRTSHNKSWQLQVAGMSGLLIPDTLITNSRDDAQKFFNKHKGKVIVKAFGSFGRDDDGWPLSVYTTPITQEHLDCFGHDLEYAPVIFQNYIPKRVELRVTVVGNQIFACAIHSQDSPRTQHDWRLYDFAKVEHEPFDLPEATQQQLLHCMRTWGLQFAAIDLVVTPDDQVVFLEVNPSGQYSWIEALTGMKISEAIARLLNDPLAHALY